MLLIDGDIIVYRSAASCEPTKKKPFLEPEQEAIYRCDAMMINIMEELKTEDHIAYFSCPAEDNFRYKVDPHYKIKRRDAPKPTHYEAVKNWMFDHWKCQICFGYEADDGIGINYMDSDIIVSIDKDLQQIAGTHYNFVKNELFDVTEYAGQLFLWRQMLEGDPADSIQGIPGIGPVKAINILKELKPAEMAETVLFMYGEDVDRFTRNFKLLKILRSEDEYEDVLRELNDATERQSQGKSLATVSQEEDTTKI